MFGRVATTALLTVLLLGAGGFSGVAAVAFHTEWQGWLLGVAGATAALVALPAGWLRTGFGVGWVLALLVAAMGRSEGDWAISSDLAGYGLLGAGLLHLGFVTATLPLRRPSPVDPSP